MQIGRAKCRQDVNGKALLARGAQIGLERKFVFIGLHQAVADDQTIYSGFARVDAKGGVARDVITVAQRTGAACVGAGGYVQKQGCRAKRPDETAKNVSPHHQASGLRIGTKTARSK